MKKAIVSCAIICGLIFSGCERDAINLESTVWERNNNTENPTASFDVIARTATGRVVMQEGTPVATRDVTIIYTGTPTAYKAVFTGDAGKIYIADPANPPAGVTGAQSGAVLRDSLRYTYPAAGTFNIVVVASNINDNGRDVRRSVVSKRITLQ